MLSALDLDADKQAFVDAVMLPLGVDAGRREELETCLAIAATLPRVPWGDSIDAATRRMQATAASFKLRRRTVMVVALAAVLAAGWWAVAGLPALRSWERVVFANWMSAGFGSICCEHGDVPTFPQFGREPGRTEDGVGMRRFLSGAEVDKQLLLVGNIVETDRSARWKTVWDRYPDDPRHYFAHALSYFREHEEWAADMVEEGEELDPGNGWFRVIAGARRVKPTMGVPPPPKLTRAERRALAAAPPKPARGKRPPPPPAPVPVILDQAGFDQAIATLDEALAMPRWDDYGSALDRIRFDATPPPEDFADHTAGQVLTIFQPEDWSRGWEDIRSYGEVFGLAAEKAAREGDRVQLEKIGRSLHLMVERLSSMDEDMLPQRIARMVLVSGSKGMAKAWKDLGELDRAKPYEEVVRDLGSSRSRASAPSLPPDALDEGRASGFLSKLYIGSRKPHSTPVTEAEVRAGRMAEYAMYERFMVHFGATLLFLVAIFLGIVSRRDRRRLGLLPERLAGLLRLGDQLLILALGFGLPMAVYVISTRVGYLGARDFALGEERFILWILQVVSLGVAVLLISLLVARWRLSRRATMLAMEGRLMDPQVWMAILALGVIPVGAVLPKLLSSGKWMEMMCWSSAGFMAGLPLLWVLYLAVYQFAGNPATRLHRALLVRGVIWPLGFTMLLAVAAIPLLYGEEKSWVARLDYDALSPEFDIFNTRGEREEGRWLQGDLKRYLESIR